MYREIKLHAINLYPKLVMYLYALHANRFGIILMDKKMEQLINTTNHHFHRSVKFVNRI